MDLCFYFFLKLKGRIPLVYVLLLGSSVEKIPQNSTYESGQILSLSSSFSCVYYENNVGNYQSKKKDAKKNCDDNERNGVLYIRIICVFDDVLNEVEVNLSKKKFLLTWDMA